MRRPYLVTTAIVFFSTLAPSIPVSASNPRPEAIVMTRDSNFEESGWSATGVFDDSGSWTTVHFNGDAPNAPTAQVITTQTSASGTFTIQFQIVVANAHNQNTWEIVDGTGGFRALHGRGTWIIRDMPDGSRHYLLDGKVHFD